MVVINCYLLTSGDDDDDEERPVTGLVQTGELFGEKPENMIQLPIIKQEDHQVHTIHVLFYIQCTCTMVAANRSNNLLYFLWIFKNY